MSESGTNVSIRQFCEDDKAAVASLYTKVFGESATLAIMNRWDWQFHNNPACDSVEFLMWVAELEDEIVGFLASFPTRFKVFDKEVIIRLPCDLMVSSAARGRRVGEKLIRAYIETEELILNALAYSPAAGRLYYRLGYREVDAERLRMRPYDLRPTLRDVLSRRLSRRACRVLTRPIASVVGGILNLGFGVINRVMVPAHSDEFDVRPCAVADAGFDELWKRISPAFPITAVRDSRWVQWRFLDDPSFEHRLLCAFDQQRGLVGYVDVRISTKNGLRFGRILDLFCDPGAPDLAESLVAAGIRHLEAEGVDMITCLGHLSGLQRVIAKFCYLVPKRYQKPALIVWKGHEAMAGAVYDSDQWHLTHADGDDSFTP
jgi:predicted N-acetyltransferase YhbS